MDQKTKTFQRNLHTLRKRRSNFRFEKIKQLRAINLSKALAVHYKNKISNLESQKNVFHGEILNSLFLLKLSSWAKDIPVEGLSPEWENNIKKSVLKLFTKKYNFFKILLDEVKQLYLVEMQKFALQRTLAIKLDEKKVNENDQLIKSNPKYLHENSKCFFKHRTSLAKKYFLSHQLVRFIKKISFLNLPQLFIDLKCYRISGTLLFSEFNSEIKKDTKKASLIILSHYYNQVIKSLPKLNILKGINCNDLPRVIHSATVLFAQQILNIKINTINHLINSIQDPLSCPLLKLDLIFENDNLSLKPSVEEIHSTYHQIIDIISNIAQDLIPFECWVGLKTNQDFIRIKLPEWFLQESHNTLEEVLKNLFQSLNEYHLNVNNQFKVICAPVTKENIVKLISEDREFEEYCSQVKIFMQYLREVNAMVLKMYYDTGIILNQSLAKEALESRTLELINILVESLRKNHEEENRWICSQFETLNNRALNIPKDAKSLFEISEYMSHGARDLVSNLEKKVQRSIQILSSLLEITILSPEHIELNKKSINWIKSIEPIFIQSNTLSEAMKSELEDELQRRIVVLNSKIDNFVPEFIILDDMDDAKRVQEYAEYLKALVRKVDEIEKQIHEINFEERLFKFPETSFPKYTTLSEVIKPFYKLVRLICEWQRNNESWLKGPFEYLDAVVIEKKTKYFFEEISESSKAFKSKIKMDLTSNKIFKFSGIVDDPDPMQQPAPLKLCWQALQDISSFMKFVPLAICMCNPALRKRHWDEMSEVSGHDLFPNAGTTLNKIIKLDLMSHIEMFQVISTGANKELALEKQLEKMFQEWKSINFQISSSDEIHSFIETEKIEILLEDHFTKIQNIRGSYFVKSVETRVIELFEALNQIKIFIQQWNCLQIQVEKLRLLFSNPIVTSKLPDDKILFSSVRETLNEIRDSISLNPTFQQITNNPGMFENLQKSHLIIKKAEESVRLYLEKTRLDFPRFFFLSDDEMLTILFNKENPRTLIFSLVRCFPGVKKFKVNKSLEIKSIIGNHSERVKLFHSIATQDLNENITDWLIRLEKEIHKTLKKKIFQAHQNFEIGSCTMNSYPGMVNFCCWTLFWTTQIQKCFQPFDVKKLQSFVGKQKDIIANEIEKLKSDLSRLNRKLISAMITLQIYQKDLTKLLITKNIKSETDFEWKAQIRFYSQDEKVHVSLMNVSISYGYEYNNQFSIVNTPLTERCYRTLMEAYHYNYFGSIIGPSGSGKTETIKSLANTFALLFKAFTGNDQLNFKYIENILKSLVACGAWICFKNFDQIEEGILSLISPIIVSISQSKASGRVNFDGTLLNFNPFGFIAITMNPESPRKFNLPESIKFKFRTITMLSPDINRICEIELFSAGFMEAESLALKINTVYKLSKELLKKFDFGLRSVKLVLKTAIYFKEKYQDKEERILVLQALVDLNISKLNKFQIPIFRGILEDVFPGVHLPNSDYKKLLEAVEEVCKRNHLDANDDFKLKIIQTFDMVQVRHGIIIIGEPLGGKSTILKTLREALDLIDDQVVLETINPGVITIDQLYGSFDEKSKKWKDGIFLKIIRSFSESESLLKKWLVFDGTIYSWIENLNLFLDDNKKLILNSHEEVSKPLGMTIFIETLDLNQASPLIISRSGIINIEVDGWRNYIKPLIKNQLEIKNISAQETLIYSLFDWSIDPCLEFIYKNCKMIISVNKIHLVISTFNLFIILLDEALKENSLEKGKQDHLMAWIQAIFIISTTWALAGTLDLDSLHLFNSFYLSLWNNSTETRFDCSKQIEMSLPTEGLIRDYIYIFKGNGSWKHCSDLLKTEKIIENPRFKEIFIPTFDSIKYSIIFQKHINHKKHFLLCSNESTGKTSSLQDLFSNKLPEMYSTSCFNFTTRMTARKAQKLFLSKLNKTKPGVYGPFKKFCIHFVDDLNFDNYSDDFPNSAVELIRQYIDHGFWYDSENPKKILIHDVMFVSAIKKINSNICARFLRHFNIYTMHTPGKESMFAIFSNVLLLNLKKNAFSMDVMSSLNGMVNATIDFYFSIKEILRPVPGRFQYIFNLMDISRLIRGCSIIQRESVDSKITFIRLWVHETFRVFGDRIIEKEDQDWFFSKLKDCVKSHFKDPFESVFDYLPKFKHEELTKDSFKFLLFGNFLDDKSGDKIFELKKYEEINSMDVFRSKVNFYINEYNMKNKSKLDMAIPNVILEHLVRVCRIMAIPGENLLMVCPSGFGRRSLIRLAAFIEKQNLFEPALDFHYGLESWREDLKSLLKNCGSADKDYSILVTDKDLEGEFYEDIISLLKTSQLPELFSSEDEREILQSVRLKAQDGNRNLELSIPEVFEYFVRECKKKLHFLICLSPLQISKTEKYLSLIETCTVNYLTSWPKDAFEKVGIKFLKGVNIMEELKFHITESCIYFHVYSEEREKRNLKIHIFPLIFIRFVKLYSKTITRKQEELNISKSKYEAGLQKLKFASDQVDQMKKVLTILRPQLESSAQQTLSTMEEIANENLAVEKATIIVKDEEAIANQKAEIAGALRTECETDLAVAIPILEDAISALNTLKPADITLVKAMKNPPDTVKLVMAAVCVMLDVPSEKIIDPVTGTKSLDFWGPSKRVLGDMNFLQILKDYDKDNISPSIMQVVTSNYMTDKSFLPHIVAKASSAAEGLCKWVRAMVSYDEVAKAVAPKKEKLALAQRECDETEAYLTEKRKTLTDLNERLSALKISLETVLAKKMELENEVADCTDKLEKAESLLTSLGGEKNRWNKCTNDLEESFNFLSGDVLLACGLITYLASHNLEKRDLIVKDWKDFLKSQRIPCNEEFNFVRILGSENKFNSWYLAGLIKNPFFLQNAVIMDNSDSWCLFIDPQNQARKWIRNLEKGNKLKIIKSNDKDCVSIIKNSIQSGNPILMENFEDLIASLDSVFLHLTYSESDKLYLDIRGEKILYSPNFRIYFTTRIKNPNFSPEIFNRMTIVDFSFPEDALSDKLLDILISKENYQVQEKFENLQNQLPKDKMALNKEEDKVLEILSTPNINILEDTEAMKILDSSKNLSVEITKREKYSIKIKVEIDSFRESYREFATYVAKLYSTVESLSSLNRMYRFSLSWFFQLYIKSIESSKRSVVLEKRLAHLKFGFTKKIHLSLRNSLLEKHKLLYSFILSVKILMDEGKISEEEMKSFMKLVINVEKLEANRWEPEIFKLEISKINRNLGDSFSKNLEAWHLYYKDPRKSIPESKDMTIFQKLIIIKVIRADQILISVANFVENILGDFKSNEKTQTHCDISMAFEESNCLTPLIFILPSHVSLLPVLAKFANQKRFSSKLFSLSMSEDQGEKAEFLIKEAQKNEKWVFLENCHLASSWMSRLEKIVESFDALNTALEFRLWLSSYPSEKFPLSVLQKGIKISCDSPTGLKESLLWIYNSEPVSEKKFFNGCPGKHETFSKLLYGLSFFHAIIKERRNYDHHGWELSYDFNESDFCLSATELQNLINEHQEMPFESFIYLVKECSYGSKISSKVDRKRLGIFIEDYCNLKLVSDSFYSFFNEPGYSMPKRHKYNDYLKQIIKIKENCNPEFLGLDENFEIIKNTREVKDFLDSFNSVSGFELEDKVEENKVRKIIFEIRNRIGIKAFDFQYVKDKYKVCYAEPFNDILIQEIEICNSILKFIETSFCALESAYDGFSLWKPNFIHLTKNLLCNLVPEWWKIKFNITESSISSFIGNLSKRVIFLDSWIKNGHPKNYCLVALDSVKAFFTAIRMKFARSRNLSINEVNFAFEISSTFELSEIPIFDSIGIYGLFLCGAQWDINKKILVNCLPKILWCEMPVIYVKLKVGNVNYSAYGYECPLYKVPLKFSSKNLIELQDNFILVIFLQTKSSYRYWLKRGTALYCKKE